VQTHALLKTLVQTLQSYKKIIDGLKNGFKKSQTYKKTHLSLFKNKKKQRRKREEW